MIVVTHIKATSVPSKTAPNVSSSAGTPRDRFAFAVSEKCVKTMVSGEMCRYPHAEKCVTSLMSRGKEDTERQISEPACRVLILVIFRASDGVRS